MLPPFTYTSFVIILLKKSLLAVDVWIRFISFDSIVVLNRANNDSHVHGNGNNH